ncbi:hypothetical protein [Kineosporia sp. NBRC 101731]|uniref:hypothetical protein n=1 Tax=Kineosporia sp. NBRC 101731 TaxID=3032199 RepID=UPI00249FFA82|nr:hypothetical protein [Kineosporia sp. NBRC 101731]GLY29989.1 hypothetical protein Kisp02_33540 [Kineosporia sp. NBRC 101731]
MAPGPRDRSALTLQQSMRRLVLVRVAVTAGALHQVDARTAGTLIVMTTVE